MTIEAIVEELKALPANELERAADYIHRLHSASRAARKESLRKTIGTITDKEADDWKRAVEEGCGGVDANEW